MVNIGITGGVGSGKSLVLEYLREKCGASVYQADQIAHQIQMPGNPCYQEVVKTFGQEILNADESIDRQRLGAVVFQDPGKLAALNAIVHPAVNTRIRELMKTEEEKGCRLFVLEAALLTDKIYREMLDEIWYIHVEEEVRRRRLAASRGYSRKRMDAMMASQPSEEVFRESCDRVIENSGVFDETAGELDEAVSRVLKLSLSKMPDEYKPYADKQRCGTE